MNVDLSQERYSPALPGRVSYHLRTLLAGLGKSCIGFRSVGRSIDGRARPNIPIFSPPPLGGHGDNLIILTTARL